MKKSNLYVNPSELYLNKYGKNDFIIISTANRH